MSKKRGPQRKKRLPQRTWVELCRHEVELRATADLLCGRRLAPDGPLPRDCVAVWYRTDLQFWHHVFGTRDGKRSGANSLFCSEAEWERWTEAARSYHYAVLTALDELHRAHGGKGYPYEDLASLTASLKRSAGAVRLRWDPLRRFAGRSTEAQRAFVARIRLADKDYRPVRTEIERRLDTPDAESRKAEKYQRAVEAHRRAVVQQVAGRRVWVCRKGTYEGAPAVFLYREDLPCRDWSSSWWSSTATPSAPLTVRELETAVRPPTGLQPRRIIWYYPACDEVEKECREQDVEITFWDLVNEVASQKGWWDVRTNRTTSARSRSVHVSSHHSSHGVGSEGSFGTSF